MRSRLTKVPACRSWAHSPLGTIKENLWLTVATYLAYCVDRELWKAIAYLKEQVRVLKEQQEKDKRILLDNRQRTRLATKAKRLTRELLEATTALFTPETVLGWYRRLIARKYDGSKNRKTPGRPRISQEVIDLLIRFKEENPHWGYTRIPDYILHLGCKISETTVKNVLIENGYDPEPDRTRKTTWKVGQRRQTILHRRRLIDRIVQVKNRIRALLKSQGWQKPRHRGSQWKAANRLWMTALSQMAWSSGHLWRMTLAHLLEELQLLETQLDHVTAYLDTYLAKLPGATLLMTIPGVGPRTAEAVLAYTGDFHRHKRGQNTRSQLSMSGLFGMCPGWSVSDRQGESTERLSR